MFCPNCGTQVADGTRICMVCGAMLNEPQPPEQQPSPQQLPTVSRKKQWIAACAALVLVAAGAWVLIWKSSRQLKYDQAVMLMEADRYGEALEKFEALGDYRDTAQRLPILREQVRQQEDYDKALALLEDHKFEQAAALFQGLGDYRDSREYLQHELPYQKALHLMEAASGDLTAISIDPISLYNTAMGELRSLDGYKDSNAKINDCYYEMAVAELKQGNREAAQQYIGFLNKANRDALQEHFSDLLFDDTSVLAALEDALQARALLELQGQPSVRELLDAEWAHLEQYKDLCCYDLNLHQILTSYMQGLQMQEDALDTYRNTIDDSYYWYFGDSLRCKAVENLYQRYGFLKDNELRRQYLGQWEQKLAYANIELTLRPLKGDYFRDAGMDQLRDLSFNNHSEYEFTLVIHMAFWQDQTVVADCSQEFRIPAHQTVSLSPDFPASWDLMHIECAYYDIMKDGESL